MTVREGLGSFIYSTASAIAGAGSFFVSDSIEDSVGYPFFILLGIFLFILALYYFFIAIIGFLLSNFQKQDVTAILLSSFFGGVISSLVGGSYYIFGPDLGGYYLGNMPIEFVKIGRLIIIGGFLGLFLGIIISFICATFFYWEEIDFAEKWQRIGGFSIMILIVGACTVFFSARLFYFGQIVHHNFGIEFIGSGKCDSIVQYQPCKCDVGNISFISLVLIFNLYLLSLIIVLTKVFVSNIRYSSGFLFKYCVGILINSSFFVIIYFIFLEDYLDNQRDKFIEEPFGILSILLSFLIFVFWFIFHFRKVFKGK